MGPAARVDRNQADIVRVIKMQRCTIQHLHGVGTGCPDLLVGVPTENGGVNILVEVKYGKGRLNKSQSKWHSDWKGQVSVIRDVKEAMMLIKQVKRDMARYKAYDHWRP